MAKHPVRRIQLLPSFSLICLLFSVPTLSESVERKYRLLHDVGYGFVPRNSAITLVATKDNSASSSYSLSVSIESIGGEDTCEKDECAAPSQVVIQQLINSGNFYRIRAEDIETGAQVSTSVNPCLIRKSNFRESINIILSATADLISMDYNPIVSPVLSKRSCSSFEFSSTEPLSFTTTSVTYTTSTPAMTVPLVLPSIKFPPNAVEKFNVASSRTGKNSYDEIIGTEGGDNPDNRPFFLRHWYIFLPLLIMSFLSGEDEPPPEGTQEQQQQQSQQPQVQQQPARKSSTPSSAPVKRRGKRG